MYIYIYIHITYTSTYIYIYIYTYRRCATDLKEAPEYEPGRNHEVNDAEGHTPCNRTFGTTGYSYISCKRSSP